VLRPAAWVAAATARTAVFAVAASHGGAAAGAMLAAALREASPDGGDVAALLSARVRGGRSEGEGGEDAARTRAPRRLVVEVPLLAGGGGGGADADADAVTAEADADAAALRALRPHLALIPNLRRGCGAELRAAAALARRVRPGGALLLCGDDAAGVNALAAALAAPPHERASADADADAEEEEGEEEAPAARAVVTFGLSPGNDWRAVCAAPNAAGGTSFTVVRAGAPLARVALRQPGEAAVRAALGAIAAAALLAAAAPSAAPGGGLDMLTAAAGGAAWRHAAAGGGAEAADAADAAACAAASAAAAALRRFPGVARSLQRVGACRRARPRRGVIVYDDAACDAAGVEDALASAAQRHDGSPLWVVFAPPSTQQQRAGADADALTGAFQGATRVVVVAPPGAASAEHAAAANTAAAALAAAIVGPPAVHAACADDVAARLAFELAHAGADATPGACADDGDEDAPPPPVVIITMGAPGVAPLGTALLARLRGGGAAPPTAQ
jgi:hypothetical protein